MAPSRLKYSPLLDDDFVLSRGFQGVGITPHNTPIYTRLLPNSKAGQAMKLHRYGIAWRWHCTVTNTKTEISYEIRTEADLYKKWKIWTGLDLVEVAPAPATKPTTKQ